jgi:hypothetical protein
MPRVAQSAKGGELELMGFRRIKNSKGLYVRMTGSELAVAHVQGGVKTCDFDPEQLPYDAWETGDAGRPIAETEEFAEWQDEQARILWSDRNFKRQGG